MNIECVRNGGGRERKATLSWDFESNGVVKRFEHDISFVNSSPLDKVVVSVYAEGKIYVIAHDGEIVDTFNIPQKEGYQYRGLNPNKKSISGVALIYVPMSDDVGNEWGDMEHTNSLIATQLLREN